MSAKKVLVLGGNGMLGHKLVQVLPGAGYDVFATVRSGSGSLEALKSIPSGKIFEDVDAIEFGTVEAVIRDLRPAAVINAVGVVKQREEGKDAAVTIEVNSVFPHRLQGVTEDVGCRLITVSTDCVFSGSAGGYIERDHADAEDLYGRSKCLGELVNGNVLTVRTSMIGREIGQAHGLLEWFLSNSAGEVRGFTNAFFSGFSTLALAKIIAGFMIENDSLRGLYHVSAERISKHDLLSLIKEKYALAVNIVPDGTFAIDRSLDSGRFRSETGFEPPDWDTMIEEMRDDPAPYPLWKN